MVFLKEQLSVRLWATFWYAQCYQSGCNQRNRTRKEEICIKRFVTRNWWHNCGGWQSKSKIHRASCQEGQAGTLGHELKLLPTSRISSSSREASTLLLDSFNWLDQAHLDYLRSSSLLKLNWLWTLVISIKYLHNNTYISIWMNNLGL